MMIPSAMGRPTAVNGESMAQDSAPGIRSEGSSFRPPPGRFVLEEGGPAEGGQNPLDLRTRAGQADPAASRPEPDRGAGQGPGTGHVDEGQLVQVDDDVAG